MLGFEYEGKTINVELPKERKFEGYSVECKYRYDKSENKYLVSMWLRCNDTDSKRKIASNGIDTQYITSTQYTIVRDIRNLIEQAALKFKFFDEYIQSFEYEKKCFERGNELYERERLEITDD